jgi:hypothetical protein
MTGIMRLSDATQALFQEQAAIGRRVDEDVVVAVADHRLDEAVLERFRRRGLAGDVAREALEFRARRDEVESEPGIDHEVTWCRGPVAQDNVAQRDGGVVVVLLLAEVERRVAVGVQVHDHDVVAAICERGRGIDKEGRLRDAAFE